MWHKDMKEGNAIGKLMPTDLLDTGSPQTLDLYRNAVSAQHNEAKGSRTGCTCTYALS